MFLTFFSSRGWESWDVEHRPLIPERMPVLIDDDLLFEDGTGAPRASVAVNRWLRELPASGAPSPKSWEYYARAVKEWMEFLAVHGVGLFDSREQLKQALGKYAAHRAAGPVAARLVATTWGQHMSMVSLFYRWAIEQGHAEAEPFTYRTARALFNGTGRQVRVNLAVRRTPKPHVTIKYLDSDFAELFLNALRGLAPDGGVDAGYRGRELARNSAVGGLALATGLRLQEFSYLLVYEVPVLPTRRTDAPIPFPVPAGVTKGGKFRTTWISYDAVAAVAQYVELDRAATVDGSPWRPPGRWGEPLRVTEPDGRGGRINGIRRAWDCLTPDERRRLVAPGGGSCLLGGRRRDVGCLRAGPGGQPPGSARSGPPRRLPGETIAKGVHTEGGRAASAARHRQLGGQDPPAGRRRGVERRLRGGLPRLLLWFPARAQPARRIGCVGGRDREEEGELDTRC